ncbi:YpiF family protein [Shouchella patagoniensis]|uniref:YpiF family protein n=1 Tax=Shouchella patagoniensis TaxID=228576 RepID=UPI000995230F|nr:YpiF family protein [Shouchella patagoniensis]
MRFKTSDIDTYLQSIEYVDTAIIPLIETTWKQDAKTVAQAVEFTTALTEEMERQFRGRIMQFPAFSYAASELMEDKIERLLLWQDDMQQSAFKHFFLVTSDAKWKQVEDKVGNMQVIFVPALPLEYIEQKNRKEVMNGQLKQILPLLTAVWQKNP